jgi:regulator of sigma E protease
VAMRETPERPGDVTPTTIQSWLWQQSPIIALLAVIVGVMYRYDVDFLSVGMLVVGLGLVIFIHELGHFVAAKWCDVHVETFSIGFGPPLPGCHFTYGETTYMLALIPLGGYVKMVGEGGDSEEGEDDPRSFKNKTVGQRMLVISAGVIMNVLLAAVCFIGIYKTTGVERPSGVVGIVESGSASWQSGLHSGILLKRIGNCENPYFDDVMPEVMHWPSEKPLPVTFEEFFPQPDTVRAEVLPRKNETTGRPMIGIAHTQKAVLAPKTRRGLSPALPGSAAAAATPAFQHGDRIVGTTDPDDPQRVRTKPLPPDPRNPGSGQPDYFELQRREQRLAGSEMTFLVRRAGDADTAEPVAIKVPPEYHTQFGLRMAMGPVVAVRSNSPAAGAGVRVKADQDPGDKLTGVEIAAPDNKVLRFVSIPSAKSEPNVIEKPLDPVRLPEQLEQWAEARGPGAKTVTLTLVRLVGHKETEVRLPVEWDDRWQFSRSAPINPSSPTALDPLGLAYTVFAAVDEVEADSPAARAGLRKDDVVKAVQFFEPTADGKLEPGRWVDIGPDQWANMFYLAQRVGVRQLGVRVQRDQETVEAVLTGAVDQTWPAADRGLVFATDSRLQKAEHFGEALVIGARRTQRLVVQIYQNLLAMIDGRISFKKNASGPLMIAVVSYDIAGESLEKFILFLGMISVNLAVINFLPIPVLDGGHMVFLIYEKLRGRPAPEQFRFAATFLGLALIGSLMLFVIYLDVKRLLF